MTHNTIPEEELELSEFERQDLEKAKKKEQIEKLRKLSIPVSSAVFLAALGSIIYTLYQYSQPEDGGIQEVSVPQSTAAPGPQNPPPTIPAQTPTNTDQTAIKPIPGGDTTTNTETTTTTATDPTQPTPSPITRRAPKTQPVVTEKTKISTTITDPFGSYSESSQPKQTTSTTTIPPRPINMPNVAIERPQNPTPVVVLPTNRAIPIPSAPSAPSTRIATPPNTTPYKQPNTTQQNTKTNTSAQNVAPKPPTPTALENWITENNLKLLGVTLGATNIATFETKNGYLTVAEKDELPESPYRITKITFNKVEITGKNMKTTLTPIPETNNELTVTAINP